MRTPGANFLVKLEVERIKVCATIDPKGRTGAQQWWTRPVESSAQELWSKGSSIKHLSNVVTTLINELSS